MDRKKLEESELYEEWQKGQKNETEKTRERNEEIQENVEGNSYKLILYELVILKLMQKLLIFFIFLIQNVILLVL